MGAAVVSAYDAVIIGAGLSGLSLARRLANSWTERRVLVIDDGHHDVRRRAWAYWTRKPDDLSSAATAQWNAIAVHASGSSAVLPIHPYRYVAISGQRLHDNLHGRLSENPNVEFVSGAASSVQEVDGRVAITIDGAIVTTRWVFDSRPLTPAPPGPRLDFLGWEIETDVDAFDPKVATFMDFRGRDPGTVRFCYALPTSARHALVEIAAFGWQHDGPELARALSEYLQNIRRLSGWSLTRTEAGSLPLTPPAKAATLGRVVPIGVRGGMLKPSTGFALERIQRQSAAITASLNRFGHPHASAPSHRRHAWLDSVFLEVLRRDPDVVETIMARLFTRNRAAAVLRFLDEDSTPTQEARLIATLPVSPFLRAALRPRAAT